MDKLTRKNKRLTRRKRRVRKRTYGTSDRPRLTVFRSLKNIYAQIIDDDKGATLCQASTMEKGLGGQESSGSNKDAAALVGKTLAERAVSSGIGEVQFDRNGRRYHGRIKALADAARKGGLKF